MVVGGRGPATELVSRVLYGCCAPEPDGGICPRSIPADPPAGVVCSNGRSRVCWKKCGALCCRISTDEAFCSGKRPFWTEVLLLQKRGLGRGKNQAGQGYEVDASG